MGVCFKMLKMAAIFCYNIELGGEKVIFKYSPFIENYGSSRTYRWSFWIVKGVSYKILFVACLDALEFYVTMIKSQIKGI